MGGIVGLAVHRAGDSYTITIVDDMFVDGTDPPSLALLYTLGGQTVHLLFFPSYDTTRKPMHYIFPRDEELRPPLTFGQVHRIANVRTCGDVMDFGRP